MFPYKTNSPDYLDYVASAMNREQILADPELCVLLENPYIKDNMEVALAWRAAKFGDYQDKYNFVEYYLCNGPELDADTLLHYRAQAQADPVVMEIAYSYFTDTNVLSEIREKKYGKKKNGDWTDCFTNPCFYLGDFSGVMGSMGDSKNVDTYFSVIAGKLKGTLTQERLEEEKAEQDRKTGKKSPSSLLGKAVAAGAKVVENVASGIAGDEIISPNEDEKNIDNTLSSSGVAPISECYESKIRPSYDVGWRKLGKSIFESDVEFAKQLNAKTKWVKIAKFGDWFSRRCSIAVDLIDKANTTRMLGDCYRMWSQVRRLRIFGGDNQYHPITSDQLVENKMPDGTIKWVFGNSHPTPADATKGIKKDIVQEIKQNVQTSQQVSAPQPVETEYTK